MERERWVCDFCGTRGRTGAGQPSETVLCPTCGEPAGGAGECQFCRRFGAFAV